MMKKYFKKVESVEIDALLAELDTIETCLDKVSAPGEIKVYNKTEINSVLGINEKCHLHVRFEDGHEEYLSGGEISVRV